MLVNLTGYTFRKTTAKPEGIVELRHEADNKFDTKAIACFYKNEHIGYLKMGSEEQEYAYKKIINGVRPKATVVEYKFGYIDDNKKMVFNDKHEGQLMHVAIELDGHTGYVRDGEEFLSITNLLGKFNIGSMSRILKWAIDKFDTEEEYDQYMQEVSAEGTALHKTIEDFLNGKGKGNEAIRNFADKFKPEVVGTEDTVFSDFGIAGTYDAILQINGSRVMIDWKRSKSVNLKHELQTSFNAVEAKADEAWVVTFGGTTKQGYSIRKVKDIRDKHAAVKHLAIVDKLLNI